MLQWEQHSMSHTAETLPVVFPLSLSPSVSPCSLLDRHGTKDKPGCKHNSGKPKICESSRQHPEQGAHNGHCGIVAEISGVHGGC